jgi:ABC-type Mn2+/Zn2+ transport system ATPase subunit
MENIIEARQLSLGYGNLVVLSEVNLDVGEGQFWFLLGPNGHGKSTFVKAVLGLMQPRAGFIRLGRMLASGEHLGFVPQRCDLNPTLPTTVREFVELGLVGLRISRSGRAGRLDEALQSVGLAERADRSYWSLSGGQRQRALLARALIRRPHLLVLDEPTSGLDLTAEDALLEVLSSLNRGQGLTILLVTHDLPLAARFASHVALFHDGRVTAGPRDEVLSSSALEATYDVPIRLHRDGRGELSISVDRSDRP